MFYSSKKKKKTQRFNVKCKILEGKVNLHFNQQKKKNKKQKTKNKKKKNKKKRKKEEEHNFFLMR